MVEYNPDIYSRPLGYIFGVTGFMSHLSVDPDKLSWVSLCPGWQDDISQLSAILFGT